MSLVFIAYLVGILSILSASIAALSLILLTLSVVGFLFEIDAPEKRNKLFKRFFIPAVFTGVISTLIPNQQTAYMMLAAYAVEEVATSETVQRLAPKSVLYIEKYIDKKAEELFAEAEETVTNE